VRFERLVIDSGDNTMAVDLHPRLTVISGMGQIERDALISEFIASLGSARAGLHIELCSDKGTRLAVFRPDGADPRVIDIDNRVDVTSHFASESGSINLLARAGLDTHSARRLMQLNSAQLSESLDGDRYVLQLATVEQSELWATANLLNSAKENLVDESDELGTSVEDAEAITRIEARHSEFEDAQEQAEQIRKVNFLVAGIAGLMAIPASSTLGIVGIGILALIAAAAVVVSVIYWRRAEAAGKAETEALEEAGAQSYLGFHLQRVNGLLGSDAKRRRLLIAAEKQKTAESRWAVLAGGVSVEWAQEHRGEIQSLAATQNSLDRVDSIASGDTVSAARHFLRQRLAQLTTVGPANERFPLLLDEPFANLQEEEVAPLLSLILEESEKQQIMLFTNSSSVESWARLEMMTGALEVVEPIPTVQPASTA